MSNRLSVEQMIASIKSYDGPKIRLMEVCGTHTAVIARSGIRSMLPPNIELVSGPGCPVCVSPASFIDALIDESKKANHVVATFGDMIRVPGSSGSLADSMADGGQVHMLYSPFDLIPLAQSNPETLYTFAAVGFETTVPVFALLVEKIIDLKINNIKLLTSLKVMPPVLNWLCDAQPDIDGFIAPGHVSIITGSAIYEGPAARTSVPFAVTGFEPISIIEAVYVLLKTQGRGTVYNLYPEAVNSEGNVKAQEMIAKYFEPGDAYWRGLEVIKDSGLYLKKEFSEFDCGSRNLTTAVKAEELCHCRDILTGRANPQQCKLFGSLCTPQNPVGACMVSTEGSCRIWMENRL